ncbi:putative endonuclease [Fontibacillus solani]|uniref:UPF0102 protein FHR92_005204 n=1 Tax=Fontibacillus solani TaxID=1572857 RepID=A0A7W3XUJ1_9BACL|nr:YraN family protein [Fontibacillus solani]MBA9088686.1 putative endonuclease [Fontibacillus solani]
MSMNDGRPSSQKRIDMDQRKARGSLAEQIAADYLIQQSYKVLERNWRCRSGEIDIVAETGHTVVIVEVRSRGKNSFTFGSPLESITSRKIKQVRNTATVYLHRISRSNARIRFDVIGIVMNPDESVNTLDHIIDAF